MPTPKQILNTVFLALYLVVLLGLGAKLFFEDQVSALASALLPPKRVIAPFVERIAIGYALPFSSLEPTLFDPVTRSRLVDVYEGLVRTDRNLKIQPAIALTWGLLDPLTWEFKLRPGVIFHNGKPVTAQDVVASVDRALHFSGSQLTNLLNTIDRLEIINADIIHIKTKKPDPLLLNKLAVTFIFPQQIKNFEQPIGTGTYAVQSTDKDNIVLKRFDAYYGPKSYFPEIILRTIPNKRDRLRALREGQVHMLADVPPAAVAELRKDSFLIASVPSLEVNFLMFDLENSLFKDKNARLAFAAAINHKNFVDIAGGFARPVGQFVSSGVFGFNPELLSSAFNIEAARKKITSAFPDVSQKLSVTLDYPEGLDIVGEYLQAGLQEIGVDLELRPLSYADLQAKIVEGASSFYYSGWRSELGDASDFLQAVAHSQDKSGTFGRFNGSHYANKRLDLIIEKSQEDLNPKTRLKALQEAMKILIEEDVIGIPLFEADTLFAYHKKLHFEPRVDGYIYLSEIY